MKTKTDIQLQHAVLEALRWEPSVNAAGIGVAVQDGVVTLSGHVPSYAEKKAAERAAQRVSGVKAIAEEIEARLPGKYQRTDADLAKAVADTIAWHVFLPEDRIKVKVEDGWVTLEGEVERYHQWAEISGAVRHLTGVRGVSNLLQIKPLAKVASESIKAKIKRALERAADADADQITVEVRGTEVTLSGTVRSFAEREDAERTAWAAPGVREVHNRIQVRAAAFA